MKDKPDNRAVHVLQMAPLGAGGITSLVLNIASHLDREKVVFDYLTFYDRKEFNEDKALSYGGKKIVVPLDKYNNRIIRAIHKFFGTIKVISENRIEIVHINASFPYDIVVGISAKLGGANKVIFHSHNSSMKTDKSIRGRIMPICKKIIPYISDCNLACSELAAKFMFSDRILKSDNFTIIKNGIDVDKYIFSPERRILWRTKLGINNRFVVGHIGRFTQQKNHKKVIDIFEKIYEKDKSALLLLIGVGELFDDIRELVTQKHLDQCVIFYGATSNVPELLQAMDCFVFPSLYEGLPVVGVEVQASGLPIVMSDTITKEVGITNLATYVSLEESDDMWANIVLKKGFENKRKNMSQEIIAAGFDIKEVADQLTTLYLRGRKDEIYN